MPFTLAHPIGALPLKLINRRLFSTTGLIVGSMAPDYEYFLKQRPSPSISETTFGVFFFDFPLAIIVALIFHLLVKHPLIQHLPSPIDHRYSGWGERPFLSYLGRHWLVFLTSVLIGIGSHLLLDWITYPMRGGPFADTWWVEPFQLGPFWTTPLIVAERIFSIAGMIVLAYLLIKLKKPSSCFKSTPAPNKWIYWGLFFATTAALIYFEWQQVGGISSFAKAITTFIWAVTVGLITASVLIKLLERYQPAT